MKIGLLSILTGLKIRAGQRTYIHTYTLFMLEIYRVAVELMSGLIADLTSQTLILPVILTGHFWI